MAKDESYFFEKVSSLNLEDLEKVIKSIPDDERLKKTFLVYLGEAKKGDKEALEILQERLSGLMFTEHLKHFC